MHLGTTFFKRALLTWCLVGFINILSPSVQSELCFTLPHPSPLSVCLLLAVKRRPYFALFVPQLLPPTFSLLTVSVQKQNTGNHMWNRDSWFHSRESCPPGIFLCSIGTQEDKQLKCFFSAFSFTLLLRFVVYRIIKSIEHSPLKWQIFL